MMFTRRSNPPPRPTKARIHVMPVRTNFEIREEVLSPPRFIRRAPVAVSECSETEDQPFIKPPTRAQLMARR